jgi:hypothetical protein
MNAQTSSPLTGLPSQTLAFIPSLGQPFADLICGEYILTPAAFGIISSNKYIRLMVASVLAQQRLRGSRGKIAIAINLNEFSGNLNDEWSKETVDNLKSAFPHPVIRLLDESLINLARHLDHPSSIFSFREFHCWYFYSDERDRALGILQLMHGMGWINEPKVGIDQLTRISINPKGWERLATLEDIVTTNSKRAFVAMWFDSSVDLTYAEGIRPAIEDCGFIPVRIDRKPHNNDINDEIIAEIRHSRFVVADFTGNRQGVYFEAGFARGLGIPVIWTVSKQDHDGVHFDTRQFNHIIYEQPQELRKLLGDRIRATI